MKRRNVMEHLRRLGIIALVSMGLLVLVGCPPTLDNSQSAYLMFISDIEPLELGSKVCDELDAQLGCVLISDDKITVSVEVVMKSSSADKGTLAKVVLNRYKISFSKISGPPLDPEVPAPVEGAITATIEVDGSATVDLVAVPYWLKNEEPLLSMRETPYDVKPNELRCVGVVELWGTDLSGNSLYATGSLTVRFTNAELEG